MSSPETPKSKTPFADMLGDENAITRGTFESMRALVQSTTDSRLLNMLTNANQTVRDQTGVGSLFDPGAARGPKYPQWQQMKKPIPWTDPPRITVELDPTMIDPVIRVRGRIGNDVLGMHVTKYDLPTFLANSGSRNLLGYRNTQIPDDLRAHIMDMFEEQARAALDKREKEFKSKQAARLIAVWKHYAGFSDMQGYIREARAQASRHRTREAFDVSVYSAPDILPSDTPGSTSVLYEETHETRVDFRIQAQIYTSGTILFSVSARGYPDYGVLDVVSCREEQTAPERPEYFSYEHDATTRKEPPDSCPAPESPTTKSSSRIR